RAENPFEENSLFLNMRSTLSGPEFFLFSSENATLNRLKTIHNRKGILIVIEIIHKNQFTSIEPIQVKRTNSFYK
ncbi:MAG: hypothetical protein VYA96_03560, partial [Verrucomicrobiota bacterium]|nr:hypothetical protein [Verrucomicrobiota bacterium]